MTDGAVYEVASPEKAQTILEALTTNGYQAYPGPSPEDGKVRIYVDDVAGVRGVAVDEIVARHDSEAVVVA